MTVGCLQIFQMTSSWIHLYIFCIWRLWLHGKLFLIAIQHEACLFPHLPPDICCASTMFVWLCREPDQETDLAFKTTCKDYMKFGLFPKCEWISKVMTVEKCALIGISCVWHELVSWSKWKHKFSSRSISDLCLNLLGHLVNMGWGCNCQWIHSLLLQEEARWFWDDNSKDDPISLRKFLGTFYACKNRCSQNPAMPKPTVVTGYCQFLNCLCRK